VASATKSIDRVYSIAMRCALDAKIRRFERLRTFKYWPEDHFWKLWEPDAQLPPTMTASEWLLKMAKMDTFTIA